MQIQIAKWLDPADIKYIVIHHSAVENHKNGKPAKQFYSIENYHKNKWGIKSQLGFYTGYNLITDSDGKTRQTRLMGEETVANKGYNCSSEKYCNAFAWCITGNFVKSDNKIGFPGGDFLTDEQEREVAIVLAELKKTFPNAKLIAHGHLMGNDTSCCGDLIDHIKYLPTADQAEKAQEIGDRTEEIARLKRTIDYLQKKLTLKKQIRNLENQIRKILGLKKIFKVLLITNNNDPEWKKRANLTEKWFDKADIKVKVTVKDSKELWKNLLEQPYGKRKRVTLDSKKTAELFAPALKKYDCIQVYIPEKGYKVRSDGKVGKINGSSSRTHPVCFVSIRERELDRDNPDTGAEKYGNYFASVSAHELTHQIINQWLVEQEKGDYKEHKVFHEFYDRGDFDYYLVTLRKKLSYFLGKSGL